VASVGDKCVVRHLWIFRHSGHDMLLFGLDVYHLSVQHLFASVSRGGGENAHFCFRFFISSFSAILFSATFIEENVLFRTAKLLQFGAFLIPWQECRLLRLKTRRCYVFSLPDLAGILAPV